MEGLEGVGSSTCIPRQMFTSKGLGPYGGDPSFLAEELNSCRGEWQTHGAR